VYYTSGAATQYAANVENQWLMGGEAATGRGTQGPLFLSRTGYYYFICSLAAVLQVVYSHIVRPFDYYLLLSVRRTLLQ